MLFRPWARHGPESDPRPQYAFKKSMINVSCNSHGKDWKLSLFNITINTTWSVTSWKSGEFNDCRWTWKSPGILRVFWVDKHESELTRWGSEKNQVHFGVTDKLLPRYILMETSSKNCSENIGITWKNRGVFVGRCQPGAYRQKRHRYRRGGGLF